MDPTFDLAEGLQQLFLNFKTGWFLGVTTLCYLCIQVVRGKAGFTVPYVTPWVEKQSKEVKTLFVLIFFSLAGFFSAFSAEKVTVSVVLDGLLKGLAFGIGTIGTRSVVKQGIEGTQAYLEKKNTTKNGSEQ